MRSQREFVMGMAVRTPRSALDSVPAGDKIVVLLRHGETAFNKHPSRMRSHLDVPLNNVGIAQAQKAAREICSRHRIETIYYGDLSRTADVAQIVAKPCGAHLVQSPWARTWDLGQLSGQYVDEIAPKLKSLTTYMRDVAPPGGESFNRFLTDWIAGLSAVIHHAPTNGDSVCIVTHVQNLLTAQAWIRAGMPADLRKMPYSYTNEDEIDPGEFFAIVVPPKGPAKIVKSRS